MIIPAIKYYNVFVSIILFLITMILGKDIDSKHVRGSIDHQHVMDHRRNLRFLDKLRFDVCHRTSLKKSREWFIPGSYKSVEATFQTRHQLYFIPWFRTSTIGSCSDQCNNLCRYSFCETECKQIPCSHNGNNNYNLSSSWDCYCFAEEPILVLGNGCECIYMIC